MVPYINPAEALLQVADRLVSISAGALSQEAFAAELAVFQQMQASADPAHSSTTLERLRNVSELRPSSADDRDDGLESDSNTKDGSDGKRKGPVSDAERKKRRQEVNRQSARRIRERRNNEMEYLKQQVQTLQHQHGLLLKYTSQLAKEKNQLIQRAMELTERWNATAAENLELRSRLQDDNVQLPGI
ncbi:hypothetical protein WJX74_008553 [Apatococcus lobatus]|uniref:BZIP domain-containing protein n=1 Tax=Apatococcus lobatus TaxID=904363 RepID=A0AAW1SG80_9CHLO